MATEHPGMGPYSPDPDDAARNPAADEPTTRTQQPPGTEKVGATGQSGSGADPTEALPTESPRGAPSSPATVPPGESAAGATGFTPDSPTRSLGEPAPTAHLDRLDGGELGFAHPNPTLPMPGMPNPLAGLGYPIPADHSADETTEVGGAVHPPPTEQHRGSIQRQEPGFTQPRPPTVAEARARDKARKRAEEAQLAAEEAFEAKRRKRKKMLIGGAAVVGVAAVVGAGYLAYEAATAPKDVTAYCVTDDNNGQQNIVDDNDCVAAQNYATSTGGYHSGLPAIFFFNGHQYRYYYGGTNTVGRPPSGGGFSAPPGAHVSTKSGTVVRGGLGSNSGGKSGGS